MEAFPNTCCYATQALQPGDCSTGRVLGDRLCKETKGGGELCQGPCLAFLVGCQVLSTTVCTLVIEG